MLSSGTTEQTQVNFRQQILTRIIEGTGIGQNTEQEIAFRIVCEHAMVESKRQLMLHIAGTGGTGKSYVIDAIVSFFEQIGFRNRLMVSAPMGCAAVLIRGNTIHSLTSLPK